MTLRRIALFAVTVSAVAQTRWPNELTVRFPDASLDIHTESSGTNSPLSTSGVVAVSAGTDSHRVVLDKAGKILFAYDIELHKESQSAVRLRIKPLDQLKIRAESWFQRHKPDGEIATLTAPRDLPVLRPGDEIQVDILYHPGTGERIFDVLRISDQVPPKPARPKGDQFSFQEVRVMLNGRIIHEPRSNWTIGPVAMIHLPGLGKYLVSLTPSPDYPFQAAGWVDHTILRVKVGEDLLEIFSKSNILQKSDYGTVWVYYEPVKTFRGLSGEVMYEVSPCGKEFRALTPSKPNYPACGIEIRTADDVESLLPEKKPKLN